MPFGPGKRTRRNLVGVDPRLVKCVMRAFELTTVDFGIIDGGGLRTRAQAQTNVKNGTGVLNSRHLTGHAVDLIAMPNGKIDWKNLDNFKEISRAMFQAADENYILLQWGADWDMDGIVGEAENKEWDYPHYQIPRDYNLERARAAQEKRLMLSTRPCRNSS